MIKVQLMDLCLHYEIQENVDKPIVGGAGAQAVRMTTNSAASSVFFIKSPFVCGGLWDSVTPSPNT